MAIFEIKGLSFKYPESEGFALKNINLSINEGEMALLCGVSGCGKTTLLRLLKKELSPFGETHGEILYDGAPLWELNEKRSAKEIGFVSQYSDGQIVTDKVFSELSFGLESLGENPQTIRLKVGEMASYFGIGEWFRKNTSELSGGQKQILNLASVIVTQPRVLIFDEPTSRLDPNSASAFINILEKLNKELGTTVIIAEHRLDELSPMADRILIMDNGEIIVNTSPEKAGEALRKAAPAHPMLSALPAPVRLFELLKKQEGTNKALSGKTPPLTVKAAREIIADCFAAEKAQRAKNANSHKDNESVLELKDVWFRYERDSEDVLRGVNLAVKKNEAYFLLGGNGAGKTTTVNVAAGLLKPYRGKVKVKGKDIKGYKNGSLYKNLLALLPQDPLTLFLEQKVSDDFRFVLKNQGLSETDCKERISKVSEKLKIENLLDMHILDISGGETQKCAIAKMLLLSPEILILDEPTKGLDAAAKRDLGMLLKSLKSEGITIITVTHDIDFAAEFADRCALLFDGAVAAEGAAREFFGENFFYTTAACRISKGFIDGVLTVEELANNLRLKD
ncbi:MAG TPA: ATP-binding cassette domain-containing protein [Clostridiales bacterium]|nr:ATP-binding cassette domain-containing protein [Clostridiales bacterium]